MKLNKKAVILAAVITTSTLLSACETGTVGDNPPKVSANPITEKYTFKDNDKTYKFTYNDPWRAITAEEGYDITLIPSDDTSDPVIKLSIKSDEKNDTNSDTEKANTTYSFELNQGIVSTNNFTLGEDTGVWISSASVEDSGYDIEGIDTSKIQDDSDEYYELGYIIKDKSVYVFKLTAKDKATLEANRDQTLSILQGIKFYN